MNRKQPGFTLVEMMITMLVGLLALLALGELFNYFRREAEHPMATNAIEQSTLTAVRWLQRDLADTNLQSIRSLPNSANPSVFPALIMESPRDGNDSLQWTGFGTVKWTKYVYYRLQPVPGRAGVGQLTYDEDSSGVGAEPVGAASMSPASPKNHRVMASDFTIGNAGEHVGFYAYWLDSSGNPHDYEDANTARAEPVVVTMTFNDISSATGKPTTRKVKLEVKPQN